MIILTINLLKNDAQVRNAFQDKFKHILVDEFQDVNTLQVRLLKYLLTESNQLFCVGDDWQSIYGWRGAEVDYIVNFKKYFENPKIIKLNINYRSNSTIVLASNEVIKNNKYKIDKEINSINKEGRKIYLYCAQKEEEDGVENVVRKIQQFLQNGYIKEDILVLFRRTRAIEPYKDKLRGLAKLRTIHSAKGLEAKIVFIVGLTAGIYGFPQVWESDRILQIIKSSNYELLMEEERRLFYVAITRAKEELFLISEVGNESQFIKEIPGEFLDRNNFLILNLKKEETIKCPGCTKEIEEFFNFCPYCGKNKNDTIKDEKTDNLEEIKRIEDRKIDGNPPKTIREIQFNEDGSLKISSSLLRIKQEEKESIVLRRVQINTNNPAIAQLVIEFPEDMNNPKKIINYYNGIKNNKFSSVDHNIKQTDKRTFIIEVKNGSKYMYSLLNHLLECFRDELRKENKVIERGTWDKYDSH